MTIPTLKQGDMLEVVTTYTRDYKFTALIENKKTKETFPVSWSLK